MKTVSMAFSINFLAVVFAVVDAAQQAKVENKGNTWIWVTLISLLVLFGWFIARPNGSNPNSNEILKDLNEKVSRGEISNEEYESRRRDLEI